MIFLFLVVMLLLIFVTYYRFWNVSCLQQNIKITLQSKLIIGIGLPRTGTSSLSKALQILRYHTHHFPIHFQEKEILYRNQKDCFIDWVTLGYRPKQLQNMFSNALFIYTFRDYYAWEKSMIYLRKLLYLCPPILKRFDQIFGPQQNWHRFKIDYENEIVNHFQKKDILYLNICKKSSWDPICQKLNLPIPTQKFPKKKEFFLQLEQIFFL